MKLKIYFYQNRYGVIVDTRKLRSYLVRAKVYPLKCKIELCGCSKKQYQVGLKVNDIDSFTSTIINNTYKQWKMYSVSVDFSGMF